MKKEKYQISLFNIFQDFKQAFQPTTHHRNCKSPRNNMRKELRMQSLWISLE